MNQLIQWNRLKAEIAQCQDIATLSKLSYSIDAIQKWAKQSQESLETQNEIAEYRIRLDRKRGQWVEENIPEEGRLKHGDEFPVAENGHGGSITLSQAGIGHHESPKLRSIARMPENNFEEYISDTKERGEELTSSGLYKEAKRDIIASKWTRDPESYTPEQYIESARLIMGSIDTDPASNEFANQIIKASTYYTSENNGLDKSWYGNVFLNPPYKQPDIKLFIEKLIQEYESQRVKQAILLTNNNTDTRWFALASRISTALCFTFGRINFYKNDGSISQPTNGQTFFYFGKNRESFIYEFSKYGLIFQLIINGNNSE